MKNFKDEDYYEGDAKYLANEALNSKFQLSDLSYKCDIFSLGLSFAEILLKIELPQSGVLWEKIRTENFYFENEQLMNSNMRNNIDPNLIKLIYSMINVDINNRPNVVQIMDGYPELNIRNKKMLMNQYIRIYNPNEILNLEDNNVILKN